MTAVFGPAGGGRSDFCVFEVWIGAYSSTTLLRAATSRPFYYFGEISRRR